MHDFVVNYCGICAAFQSMRPPHLTRVLFDANKMEACCCNHAFTVDRKIVDSVVELCAPQQIAIFIPAFERPIPPADEN